MTNELTNLDNLDKTGAETLLALLQTKTDTEAAERLLISRTALYDRINKYGLNQIIEQFPKQALLRLQLGSTRAADTLVNKLDDRRESLQAATEILDRVGLTGDKPAFVQQINVGGDMGVEFIKGENAESKTT